MTASASSNRHLQTISCGRTSWLTPANYQSHLGRLAAAGFLSTYFILARISVQRADRLRVPSGLISGTLTAGLIAKSASYCRS
jgi:hypothetical protein